MGQGASASAGETPALPVEVAAKRAPSQSSALRLHLHPDAVGDFGFPIFGTFTSKRKV